jgi:drug/metabolite transporter (DMT)-like permease
MLQGTRFLLASVMVAIWTWKDIRKTTKKSLKAGLILGLLLGIGFALQTIGLKYTTASKAGFFTGTLVVLTPILQIIIERRLPSVGNAIGVILVGIGIFIFSSPAGGALNIGDFLVLACALVFAFYVVYLDVFTKDKFDREIVFYQFIVTAAMGFILAPFLENPVLNPTTDVVYSILYLSLFASTIALFVQSKYQRETTPTKAAIIFTMEPVMAAIIAYFALNEVLGPTALLGAGIMLAGLFVSEIYTIVKNRSTTD